MYESYDKLTLTQLGDVFGVKRRKMGTMLVEVGLRYRNHATNKLTPSQKAFNGDYCSTESSRGDGYFWVWDRGKTIRALVEGGFERVDKPTARSEPEECNEELLHGPFSLEHFVDDVFRIVNGDGTATLWIRGERDAKKMLTLMNHAHKREYMN